MSLTGRPSNPPLALISFSQICAPSSACLPAPASAPVCAMLKPILMGAPPPCAKAGADAHAGEMSAAPMPAFTWRRVMRLVMDFLPKILFSFTYPDRVDPAVLLLACASLMGVKREPAGYNGNAALQGLQQLGWTVGQNVEIEYRWSGGTDEVTRRHAAELAPKMKARLAEWGATALAGSPADFDKLIADETE